MKYFILLIFLVPFQANSQSFERSGWCQRNNNVNNSTIPVYLDNLKRAVFKFNFTTNDGKTYTCTGTLVNQITSQGNLQQYF